MSASARAVGDEAMDFRDNVGALVNQQDANQSASMEKQPVGYSPMLSFT
jgi:hypothetical protein